jgi:hypothetical protein
VDRAFEAADFASYAEQIWAELHRAAVPHQGAAEALAHSDVPVPIYPTISAASCHAFACELAFRVLNNARIAAGYAPIFPPAHHPRGFPPFFEQCRLYPRVFDSVAAQGFIKIGEQWTVVQANLRECFPQFDDAALIGMIQKEAAQARGDSTLANADDAHHNAKSKSKFGSTKGKRIDERMLATIRDNSEAVYRSGNEWADSLRCAKSTVLETQT